MVGTRCPVRASIKLTRPVMAPSALRFTACMLAPSGNGSTPIGPGPAGGCIANATVLAATAGTTPAVTVGVAGAGAAPVTGDAAGGVFSCENARCEDDIATL